MLSVQALNTEYVDGNHVRVRAARDVSFEVPAGKLFTLLGPSGCGKTTTLRSIAGLEKPVGGAILVNGVTMYSSSSDTFVPPNRRQFGMVFQSYAIWPHMTVFRNASFPLEVGAKKYSKREIEEKVMRVLTGGRPRSCRRSGRDADVGRSAAAARAGARARDGAQATAAR